MAVERGVWGSEGAAHRREMAGPAKHWYLRGVDEEGGAEGERGLEGAGGAWAGYRLLLTRSRDTRHLSTQQEAHVLIWLGKRVPFGLIFL